MTSICRSALFAAVMFPGTAACAEQPNAEQPNIVFVMADDCTFRDLGCYGGQARTPYIDALAEQGMRFTRCFQAAPMCSPTRHNIYTGLYPVKSGAYPNHTFVHEGTRSVAHYLKSAGYRVALSGKTHINPRASFPFEYSAKNNNPDMSAIDTLMKECRQSETPFCLFACSNEPHTPWNRGDASQYRASDIVLPHYFADTPETRESMTRYLAEVTYYDGQVGHILGLLDQHGLSENTLVMVVSEQGSGFPFAKWTCYDSGLQSACIVRWPGTVKAGVVSDAMIEYVDFLPTFLEAASAASVDSLDGKSFVDVLRGNTDQHKDYVFGEMTTRGIINGSDHYGIRSVRSARYKYIWNFTPEVEFRNACTKSPEFLSWVKAAEAGDAAAAERVHRYQHRPGEELYDVSADPLEWKNLADEPQMQHIKVKLREQLQSWMVSCGDKGQQTELEANERQRSGRSKKKAR